MGVAAVGVGAGVEEEEAGEAAAAEAGRRRRRRGRRRRWRRRRGWRRRRRWRRCRCGRTEGQELPDAGALARPHVVADLLPVAPAAVWTYPSPTPTRLQVLLAQRALEDLSSSSSAARSVLVEFVEKKPSTIRSFFAVVVTEGADERRALTRERAAVRVDRQRRIECP